ncbi:MAG: metallophosphoesterase [Candidatus Wallbacteria bacterium]|nr:metallophosphoesterase [Candidatus Wallbacteria bacterium]
MPKISMLFLLCAFLTATFARDIDVYFHFKAPQAKTICIAMECMDWEQDANPMQKGPDGVFTLKMEINPGEYPYMYVVDGKYWVQDPEAQSIRIENTPASLLIVGTEAERAAERAVQAGNADQALQAAQDLRGYDELSQFQAPANFCFGILGDCRDGEGIYKALLSKIKEFKGVMVANNGDMVSGPTVYNEWLTFIQDTKNADIPFVAALGNHDTKKAADTVWDSKLFKIPQKDFYYSLNFGNCAFFFLNTEYTKGSFPISGAQMDWLKSELSSSTAKNKFVFVHRPLYPLKSQGQHYNDSLNIYPADRDALLQLFKDNGVKYIFCGHEHFYNRQTVEGVENVIVGGAGAPLYTSAAKGGYYHFVLVTVKNGTVKCEVYKYDSTAGTYQISDTF